jgi:hypothetical protein
VRAAEQLQLRIEIDDALLDELDPAVDSRQGVQDVGIEDEDAPHAPCGAQRVIKRGVVVNPQIAAKPDECAVERLVHDRAVWRIRRISAWAAAI